MMIRGESRTAFVLDKTSESRWKLDDLLYRCILTIPFPSGLPRIDSLVKQPHQDQNKNVYTHAANRALRSYGRICVLTVTQAGKSTH